MKQWKKTAIAFTVATGLLLTATATVHIHPTYAAPNVKHVQSSHQQTIKKIKSLAVSGKTVNSGNFSLGSNTNAIVKKWGKPDRGSDKNHLYYSKHRISFFANHNKVKQINSNDRSYSNVSYKEVVRELGKPVRQVKGQDGVYASYKAGKHTLTTTFYYDNRGTAPSTIKEVTVL